MADVKQAESKGAVTGKLMTVALNLITLSKTNPRKHFDDDAINELAQSILEKGVIQPILLRPTKDKNPDTYELVCGERRYRASLIAAGTDPALNIIPAYIRELTDDEAFQLQITENLQRKDVHPIEEAFAFKILLDKYKGDYKEVSVRVAKKPHFIKQRIKLNDLTDNWQKVFFADKISLRVALNLCVLPAEAQDKIWKDQVGKAKLEEVHFEMEDYDFEDHEGNLKTACFDITSKTLDTKAGACVTCPFNSAVSALFPELAEQMTCSNVSCYNKKEDTHLNTELKIAMEDPLTLLVSDHWGHYNDEKIHKDLKKKNHRIYYDSEYNMVVEPTLPVKSEGVSDKDFKSAMKHYEDKKKTYEDAVAGGKYKKAFMLDGQHKGKYVYVLIKSTDKAKPKAKDIKKAGPDKLTVSDINAEVDRIKEREKRSKEIDCEKIQPLVYETLSKSLFPKKDAQLSVTELISLAIAIVDNDGEASRWIYKEVGARDDYHTKDKGLYDKLMSMKGNAIPVINNLIRKFILNKLKESEGTGNHLKRGASAAIHQLATDYAPDAVKKIVADQEEIAKARNERVNKRLADLGKKKAEMTKPAAKPSAVGKGVKALVGDAPDRKPAAKKAAPVKKATPAKKAVKKAITKK